MAYRVLILVFVAINSLLSGAEKKPRVGVVDFSAVAVSASDAQVVGSLFRGDIVSSGAFDVLDRKNMNNILKEQQFQQTGCTESTCAVQLGRLLNMEYMLYGALSKLGAVYIIQVEMVNIETSQIVISVKEKFGAIESADETIASIVGTIKWKASFYQKELAQKRKERGAEIIPIKEEVKPEQKIESSNKIILAVVQNEFAPTVKDKERPVAKMPKSQHVGILSFESGSGVAPGDASGLTDLFRVHLVNARYFTVLDRNNMDQILKEQQFQQTGCTESACAVKLGKLLSMEYMAVGKVTRVQNTFILTVSLINVETSAVHASQKVELASMANADGPVQDLVRRLVFAAKGRAGMTMQNPWGPILYSSAGVTLAAAISMNIWGAVSANNAGVYYTDTYKRITNDTAAAVWDQYSSMLSGSQMQYIVGYSLYAVSAGLFVWALLQPPEIVKETKVSIIPIVTPDTYGMSFSYRF